MPFGKAQSLEADETCAIVACQRYLQEIVEDDFELTEANFTEQRLPGEENFLLDDRAAAGANVFRMCKVCDQAGASAVNRIGSVLNAVVGGAMAAIDGFKKFGTLKEMGDEGMV